MTRIMLLGLFQLGNQYGFQCLQPVSFSSGRRELDSLRVKGPAAVNLKITDDRQTSVIHTNRVWNHVQPQQHTEEVGATRAIARSQLVSPLTDHLIVPYAVESLRDTIHNETDHLTGYVSEHEDKFCLEEVYVV